MFTSLFYALSLIYEEIIYKLFTNNAFSKAFIFCVLFVVFFACLLGTITGLFNNKTKKIITIILSFIISFFFGLEIIYTRILGSYFSIDALSLSDQVTGEFLGMFLQEVLSNWYVVLAVFVPFIISFFIKEGVNDKKHITSLVTACISIGLFFVLLINNEELNDLYFHKQLNSANVDNFGALHSVLIEGGKKIIGFKEEVQVIQVDEEPVIEEPQTIYYDKQILDIDFASINENETNQVYKMMNEYFMNEDYTMKNEYTGFFEDKNLILFMAESFTGYVVDKDLTPTLYKLVNGGFTFTNFYSPLSLSTIGGEFQELTGLFPYLNTLSSKWRTGTNYYPFGIATLFKEKGYSTYSYHNNWYAFQDRNVYLESLGFDSYLGCYNGLENRGFDCEIYPTSDNQMIELTIDDYIHDDKFLVYYATYSGHKDYSLYGNAMCYRHKDEVENLEYSPKVKAYIASQLELELALTTLLNDLEAAGRLDDTVIALVCDHYPYALSLEEMRELSGKNIDANVELCRSNFILYNSAMENVVVDTVGSQVDVIPTIYNLFNMPYDSRLIIGKDILSLSNGLAYFSNYSWTNNFGTYFAANNYFDSEYKDSLGTDYVEKMSSKVYNRILMSRYIMEYNYYNYLFKKMNNE